VPWPKHREKGEATPIQEKDHTVTNDYEKRRSKKKQWGDSAPARRKETIRGRRAIVKKESSEHRVSRRLNK